MKFIKYINLIYKYRKLQKKYEELNKDFEFEKELNKKLKASLRKLRKEINNE